MSWEQLPLPDMPTPPPVQPPASATALLARLRRAGWNASALDGDGRVHVVRGDRADRIAVASWVRQVDTGTWKFDSCWTRRRGDTTRALTLAALNALIAAEKNDAR